MYPRVTVIIPAYNAEKTIENLLRSLSNQTFSKEKTEIIVVNDCSTDNTLKILSDLQKEFSFTLISHETNKGLATTRNTGIKNSTGKIVIFIDADMTVSEEYIENHVNFHNNQNVMGVVGGIQPSDDIKMDKYQKYLYRGKRGIKKYDPQLPLPYNIFLFNNTSIKREVIETCGVFDETIKIYGGEDTEFAYRVHQKYPQNLFHSCTLTAVHHHYRSFDNALKNLLNFAKTNIPYIINKHPEMAKLYGLKYISKNYDDSSVIHRIIGRIFCLNTFFYINKFLYNLLPFPLSIPFTRILMASKLLQGIKKGLEK